MKTPRASVPKGFRVRTIKNDEDIEMAVQFNDLIHGEPVGEMVRALCTHHPATSLEDFFFVEEEATGKMVSFLCLIPLKWSFEGVELKVAELGCVGTLESYRRRGFIRALNQRYEERLKEGGYDLSVVEGIPYFYRQFGYEYALPLGEECTISLDQIPDQKEGQTQKKITIRPFTLKDIPEASRLFEQSVSKFSIHTIRNEDIWRYQEERRMASGERFESYAVESNGTMIGYFRLNKDKDVSILEASDIDYDSALEVLRYAKSITKSEEKSPYIKVRGSSSSPFVEVAKYLGGKVRPHYAFQIRIPDVCRFLTKMKPILERRIRDSVLRGLTATVKINLYIKALELHFVSGEFQKVVSTKPSKEWDVGFHPLAFYKLLVGYKNREELSAQYHDVIVNEKMHHIIDTLFPKTISFIHTGY